MSINSFSINSRAINTREKSTSTITTLTLVDSLGLQDTLNEVCLRSFSDSLAFIGAFQLKLAQGEIRFEDSFGLSDSFQNRVRLQIEELFALNDSVSVGAVIQKIADTLVFDDSFETISITKRLIESQLGFSDSIVLRHVIEWEDAISFVDLLEGKIHQILTLLDSISFSDSLSATFLVEEHLIDSFQMEDSIGWKIQKILQMQDTFGIIGSFTFVGETYLVWATNPKGHATFKWEYQKKWNSFARIGGKNLFCGSDGIYEVGGSDDDGESIDAFVRTGLVSFNDPERHYPGEKLKQLLNAYLVLTTEGETLLKVVTTRRGTAEETWFKCLEKPSVMSKAELPISHSLRSVLFQFELKPLAGSPANYNSIEIIPLFLTRSI